MNETYEQKRIKSLEAMLDTEREMARAEHQSSLNLVRYCGDESAWSLPMRGNDLVVRDCIRAFRTRLAEAEAIVAAAEKWRQYRIKNRQPHFDCAHELEVAAADLERALTRHAAEQAAAKEAR